MSVNDSMQKPHLYLINSNNLGDLEYEDLCMNESEHCHSKPNTSWVVPPEDEQRETSKAVRVHVGVWRQFGAV